MRPSSAPARRLRWRQAIPLQRGLARSFSKPVAPECALLYTNGRKNEANLRMNATLPVIRLRPREGRRVRAGSPWAFSNEIIMDGTAKSLPPGALVRLASDDGTPIGNGYFNTKSFVPVRVFGGPNLEIRAEILRAPLNRAIHMC